MTPAEIDLERRRPNHRTRAVGLLRLRLLVSFLLAAIAVIQPACTATATYSFSLTQAFIVEPTEGSASTGSIDGLTYEDDWIKAAWTPRAQEFILELTNVGIRPFAIEWEGVRFIDPSGRSLTITHSAAWVYDYKLHLPPERLAPNEFILRRIVRDEGWRVFNRGPWDSREGAPPKPLLPRSGASADALAQSAGTLKGTTVTVIVPIALLDSQGRPARSPASRREYEFQFTINDVTIIAR